MGWGTDLVQNPSSTKGPGRARTFVSRWKGDPGRIRAQVWVQQEARNGFNETARRSGDEQTLEPVWGFLAQLRPPEVSCFLLLRFRVLIEMLGSECDLSRTPAVGLNETPCGKHGAR